MQIYIKSIGLAAYVKMNGLPLIGVEDKKFVFTSDKTEQELQIEYFASCCSYHDSEVCNLRKLLK